MYATRQTLSGGSRGASFGAALAINGALIAGLIFAAPEIVKSVPDGPIDLIDITQPPPPPPIDPPEPAPQPKTVIEQPRPIDPIVIPDAKVPTAARLDLSGTIEITTTPPSTGIGEGTGATGTGTAIDPPKPPPPLPPLVRAEIDSRYAGDFQPDYPPSELRLDREGTVSVRVTIGTDGRVKSVEKLSATSDAFYEATRRQALSRWRFKPATRGGVPQESTQTMSVRFDITSR